MKIIGVNGSARKDGNTAILINTTFETLNHADIETELIQLAENRIGPCKACFACGGQKNCVHRKDAFAELFKKMPGDVLKDAEGLATMRNLAENLI